MRRRSLVLLTCVAMSGGLVRGEEPRSIYSDPVVSPPPSSSSNQSVYEKFTDIAPMDHAPTYRQADLDAANQRYNDAVKALGQAKQNVAARLAADPNFSVLQAHVQKAQSNYDDEIEDAMSVIDYYDDYQELLQPALEAQKRLVFLEQNSPDDSFAISSAQKHFDALRRAVAEYEDGTLDNDQYVQQARRDFLAAREERDKFESDALAADPAVRDAQASVDGDKQTLDTIAAQVARSHPQPPATPDNSAVASDDQNVTEGSDETMVQDGDDSGDADQGAGYDPSDDQDNTDIAPQVYQPVADDFSDEAIIPDTYPDTYFVGTVVEIRDHYHHTHDRAGGDDRYGHWDRLDHPDRFESQDSGGSRFAGRMVDRGGPNQREADMNAAELFTQEQAAIQQQQQQAFAAQQAFETERQARFTQARENWARQAQQQNDAANAQASVQRAEQAPPNNTRSVSDSGHWSHGGDSNSRQNASR